MGFEVNSYMQEQRRREQQEKEKRAREASYKRAAIERERMMHREEIRKDREQREREGKRKVAEETAAYRREQMERRMQQAAGERLRAQTARGRLEAGAREKYASMKKEYEKRSRRSVSSTAEARRKGMSHFKTAMGIGKRGKKRKGHARIAWGLKGMKKRSTSSFFFGGI